MEKLALITGASKGIGKEFADIFAQQGYSLILIARNIKELEQLQLDLKNKYQCNAKILSIDLANPTSIDVITSTFKDEISKLDVLVNNAGVGLVKEFADMPAHELNNVLDVNIVALTWLTYRVLPHMAAKKSGRILNVASTAAYMPGPYMSVYYASKAYVLSFSEAIHEEYKPHGVTISTLCPGITNTAFLQHAGIPGTFLYKAFPIMTAKKVATIGFKGLMKNKRVIVPGIMNKLSLFLTWMTPRFISAKVTGALQRPRSG